MVGFKSQDLVILEEDFKKSSDKLVICTDDGSYGRKGLVTEALKELLDEGNQYDEIFAIGPMIMMKFVCKTTEPYGRAHHRVHESHYDRRHRHVRRLPPERWR